MQRQYISGAAFLYCTMRLLAIIIFCLIGLNAYSQRHDNIWLFGRGAGLDFSNADSTTLPIPFSNPVDNFETTGCYSDLSGDLQIAFKGQHFVENDNVYYWIPHFLDSNYEEIPYDYPSPNSIITLSDGYTSFINDSIFISSPKSITFLTQNNNEDTIYALAFLAYMDANQFPKSSISALRFIKLNDGYTISGGFNPVTQPGLEYMQQFAAVKHANGDDWWIITHRLTGKQYEVALFSDGQVNLRKTISVGLVHFGLPGDNIGEITFNQSGEEFVLIVGGGGGGELMSFDRCSGEITAIKNLTYNRYTSIGDPAFALSQESSKQFGASFSGDGRLLYTVTSDSLFQWDLSSVTPSPKLIWADSAKSLRFHAPELGPDDRIYIPLNSRAYYFPRFNTQGISLIEDTLNMHLSIIHRPNRLGQTCEFEHEALTLPFPSQHRYGGGFPSFPNYRLGKLEPPEELTIADTSVCPDSALQIGLEEVVPFKYEWTPIDGLSCTDCANPWLVASETQDYIVTATTECTGPKSDTVTITVLPEDHPQCKVPDTIVPPDTVTGVFIPNVITPNGDGINDFFQPSGDFESYTLHVIDRNGRQVFSGNSSWRPTSNIPEGVYFYTCKLTQNGNLLQRSGSVTLLR